jgi:hypothetical protein
MYEQLIEAFIDILSIGPAIFILKLHSEIYSLLKNAYPSFLKRLIRISFILL